jgi:hypothetical protein
MSEELKLSPHWYAAGMFCAIPIIAVGLLVSAIALIAIWPFAPAIAYLDRKREFQK